MRGGAAAPDPGLVRQREVVDAFLAALRAGDFEGLLAVLDPDLVVRADMPSAAPSEIRGADGMCRSRPIETWQIDIHQHDVVPLSCGLSDGAFAGFDDVEIITWVFTDDPTLPGRPIDALRENRGSEVKRRAQAMGF